MNSDSIYCVLDYETYSEVNLKKVGAYEYSVHPSTEILCVAWKVGTRETLKTAKTELCTSQNIRRVRELFYQDIDYFVAHNALFEQLITTNVLFRGVAKIVNHPEHWICTASLAAALSLPRSLEEAAKAFGLQHQKDMEGNRLIQKWCKPRKVSKNNQSTRHDDVEEFKKIIKYCMKDVDTTAELFLKCPPLTETERKVWELDQKINMRGFLVDRPLVTKVMTMIGAETRSIDKKTEALTCGVLSSAKQRDGVLTWLRDAGLEISDLRAGTVSRLLASEEVTGDVRSLLAYRAAISKTSTAKYQAFEERSRSDGRVRDILLYHAASTGRWGGRGVQPQNFPRGNIADIHQACEVLNEGEIEWVRTLYGDPLDAFSSCLRGMIIAPPQAVLDVADYSAIETRVLFWVARHETGIRAFREGRDLYKELAARIFRLPVSEIDDKGVERFVGKTATLGCGYQMGWKKFQKTCEGFGHSVSDIVAQNAVTTYRTTHHPVTVAWDNVGRAAIAATTNPGQRYAVNRTSWWVENRFLWCQLPSGRRLPYFEPRVQMEATAWGDYRPTLTHYGVNSLSKKWERTKTYGGKLVENVVQAISRDIMAEAMLRIDVTGEWNIVLSVHDELIAERPRTLKGSVEDFENLMKTPPEWGKDIPIDVKGWSATRYRK